MRIQKADPSTVILLRLLVKNKQVRLAARIIFVTYQTQRMTKQSIKLRKRQEKLMEDIQVMEFMKEVNLDLEEGRKI